MGKSTSGIGMTDVAAMMAAIEGMHTCRVELRATTAGQAHNGALAIVLEAIFPTLPESDLPRVVGVRHSYPSKAVPTFEGLVYNLCWQLDYAIQKAYENMPLKTE